MAVSLLVAAAAPEPALALRPIPNTTGAVHVWDDQLPDSMSDAQSDSRPGTSTAPEGVAPDRPAARAVNRGFLVLYYRLGIGDGPVPFRLGNRWASDYGSVTRHESWFWHAGGRRVLNTQSDWYVMNPDSGWRGYWASSVLRNSAELGDDGVFADSLSVPQYLGADNFNPPFQYIVGEGAWTARIDRFMRFQTRRLRGRLWFIPTAGSWITTRDRTDYSIPDGVMIEAFAEGGPSDFYALSDWQLEMNRVLALVRRGKVILAQSYLPGHDRARVRARVISPDQELAYVLEHVDRAGAAMVSGIPGRPWARGGSATPHDRRAARGRRPVRGGIRTGRGRGQSRRSSSDDLLPRAGPRGPAVRRRCARRSRRHSGVGPGPAAGLFRQGPRTRRRRVADGESLAARGRARYGQAERRRKPATRLPGPAAWSGAGSARRCRPSR